MADGRRQTAAQLSAALQALRDGLATRGAVAHTRRQAKVWCGELRAAGVEEKLVRRAGGVMVGVVLGKGLTVVEPAGLKVDSVALSEDEFGEEEEEEDGEEDGYSYRRSEEGGVAYPIYPKEDQEYRGQGRGRGVLEEYHSE